MRPPDASRDLSTKDQLKENFPHARIISSNSWHALFLFKFRKFRVSVLGSVDSVVFFRTTASISPLLALASCSLLLLLVHRAARSPGRARASAVSWQEEHRPRERRQQHSLRLPERRSEGRRRPAPPTPPGASAWPSSSLDALQHRRRGLRCAEHALCRRRAREAVPSKPREQSKSNQG